METTPQQNEHKLPCEHKHIEVLQGEIYKFPKGYLKFDGLNMEQYHIGKSLERIQCVMCRQILEVSAY